MRPFASIPRTPIGTSSDVISGCEGGLAKRSDLIRQSPIAPRRSSSIPRRALAYLKRGSVWALKRDYARAKPDLDEPIRLDATNPLAWSQRYSFWMHEGNVENALKDIEEAIRIDPKDPNRYLERGDVWVRKGNRERASC